MQRYCLTVLIFWLGLMSYQVDAEAGIQETFEDTTATWVVSQDTAGSGYKVEVAKDLQFPQKVFIDSNLPATSVSVTVNPPIEANAPSARGGSSIQSFCLRR